MKHTKLFLMVAMLALLTTQCKKKEEPEPEPPVTVVDEDGQSGKDSRDAQSENDLANDDINKVVSENIKLSGKGLEDPAERPTNICGLSIDTTQASMGVLTLSYTGVTCNNRTRTGTIVLALQNYSNGTRWKDAGAIIKVDFQNYKVTRASDQASIKFNGTQYLTNISGGNWFTFLILQTPAALVSSITGTNMNVTWNDNKVAVYNINRKVTYTISGLVISVKAEGIGSSAGLNNLENFGTTRDGASFTSQVNTPIIWNTTCGAGAPLQGEVLIKVAGKSTDLKFTYGVNALGIAAPVIPNACPFGWKVEWTVNGAAKSKVTGYN